MRLEVEQLEYEIDDTRFGPGRSFFLPCLAPAKARKIVERELRAYHILTKIVIEDGISGLRVWRMW